MAVNVKKFLMEVESIVAEEPGYQTGHDGHDGLCDCIGLIIGAIRRAGGEWTGLHGSNYAARHEVEDLRPIYGNGGLKPGEVVFKAYEPGQKGYKLPERYNKSGDKRDYYHIGVVVSVYPLRIRHMTAPKPKTDTSIGKWAYHGWLKKISVEAEGENPMEQEAKVVRTSTSTGNTVNLRAEASDKGEILKRVPFGSAITVSEDKGKWCRITYQGISGWMMSNYVEYEGEIDEGEDGYQVALSSEKIGRIESALQMLEEAAKQIDSATEQIGAIVGRG